MIRTGSGGRHLRSTLSAHGDQWAPASLPSNLPPWRVSGLMCTVEDVKPVHHGMDSRTPSKPPGSLQKAAVIIV